jgi:hypothetical protein
MPARNPTGFCAVLFYMGSLRDATGLVGCREFVVCRSESAFFCAGIFLHGILLLSL